MQVHYLAVGIKRLSPRSLFVPFFLSFITATSAVAQTMVPVINGVCPSGTNMAGSGYCRSTDGSNFVPSINGICPSGSNIAGAGYCRSSANIQFVPAHNGICPSGTNIAGAGYCAVRH